LPTVRPQRIEPGPGQESVWDYPRPPDVRPSDEHVVVIHRGMVIAGTRRAVRVCETSQAPAYYLPRSDIAMHHLVRTERRSYCEWKGEATYWGVQVGDVVLADAAWSYESPTAAYRSITGYLAFYAQKLDECRVDGELVEPNAGGFYGGWVTSRVVGPFKGAPGTQGW
jgi:uncharacterized protein (DUF427 family)